jgi:hypothetical protein
MKPFLHAKSSVHEWGGSPEDYLPIHDFIDSTKAAHPDMRHRTILHNAFGCFLVEKVFGHNIVNSDGKQVSTRDIAERHIIEDLGFIPTISDYLNLLPMPEWIGGRPKRRQTIKLDGSSTSIEQLREMFLKDANNHRQMPNYTQELVD